MGGPRPPGCSPVGLQHQHGGRTGAARGGWGGSQPPQGPQSPFASTRDAAVLCRVLPRACGTSLAEGAGSCPGTQRAPAQPRSGATAALWGRRDGSCRGSHGPVPGLARAARARAESAAPRLGPWFTAGEASQGGWGGAAAPSRSRPSGLLPVSCRAPNCGPPPTRGDLRHPTRPPLGGEIGVVGHLGPTDPSRPALITSPAFNSRLI